MMTALAKRLIQRIRDEGPIPVVEYMGLCLFDRKDGYYMSRDPIGRDGDFITAPEISQVFGEMIAVWMVSLWQQQGRPAPVCLAEIGPGRGTLMLDMLRIFRRIAPDLLQAARIRMIETSPRLAAMQRQRLASADVQIEWVARLAELPDLPLLLVGNELFDAIPIRQYVRMAEGWRERVVGLDAEGHLCFLAGPGSINPALLPDGAGRQPPGTIFEIAPGRESIAEEIGERISRLGLAALFFDYGHLQAGFGDTLQAVRAHAPEDVLAAPGAADLTSHVDFSALARAAARGGSASAFLTQREFLGRMGAQERVEQLTAAKPDATAASVRSAVLRLMDPAQMGTLFKAMAIFPKGEPPYPFRTEQP